jgi:hypothetical protein
MIKKARVVQDVEYYVHGSDDPPPWIGMVRTYLDEGDVVVYFPFLDEVRVFTPAEFAALFVPLPSDK